MQNVFLKLKSRLLRITGGMLLNSDDAADAVQETFCRLWQIRDRINSEQEATALAIQTAKNICIDQLRRNQCIGYRNINEYEHLESKDSTQHQIEVHDEYQIVKKLIQTKLSPLQRTILEMKEIEEYEIEEIAQKLEMQPTAVRMNLSRARKEIRTLYEQINKQ